MTDFSTITACGECCAECPKKLDGRCPGCIEADGRVPEWAGSGRCKVHACAKEHHAPFCGLCEAFPCEKLPSLISWNPGIIEHMAALRDEYRKVHRGTLTLVQLTHDNYRDALSVNRDDIPEAWVDTAGSLMEVTDYGAEHGLIGHTFVAYADGKPVGLIMIGEALAWDTDPDEMKGKPFYRVMGFVVDREYRSRGIGGEMLESAICRVYDEFGKRSIALGVHKDNARVGSFYERHGFRRTGVYEGNDEYYLRMIDCI